MKGKLLIGFMTATLSFANMAYANFTFYSSNLNDCNTISGSWAGSGKATNWLIGECSYHGAGTISALDSAGKFTIVLAADKNSGSFLCPQHTDITLSGVCMNGMTTIMTEYGNLTGNFSQYEGDAKGTLTVSPGMKAEVSVQFMRAG